MEASATTSLKLTGFGELIPNGEAGRHSYTLERPPEDPKHECFEFVPTPGAKSRLTAGSCFSGTVDSSNGIGHGALKVVWRLSYDAIGHPLTPMKPPAQLAPARLQDRAHARSETKAFSMPDTAPIAQPRPSVVTGQPWTSSVGSL